MEKFVEKFANQVENIPSPNISTFSHFEIALTSDIASDNNIFRT